MRSTSTCGGEPGAAVGDTEVARWHAGEIARIAEPFPVEIDMGRLAG